MASHWQPRFSKLCDVGHPQSYIDPTSSYASLSSQAAAARRQIGGVVPPTIQSITAPPKRRRPKYTRSKNGCLTCRTKKIKCDEVHPVCTRCVQSQRECTWPENVVTKRETRKARNQEILVSSPSSLSDHSTLSSSTSTSSAQQHSPIQLPESRMPSVSPLHISPSLSHSPSHIHHHSQPRSYTYPSPTSPYPAYSYSGHLTSSHTSPLISTPVQEYEIYPDKWANSKWNYSSHMSTPGQGHTTYSSHLSSPVQNHTTYQPTPLPHWQSSLLFNTGQRQESYVSC